jgi:zinc protease
LDGGNSARLPADLVRGKEIAISAGAGYNLTARLPELFTLEATPAEGHTVADLETALLKEVAKLKTELVSNEELQRIKAQVLAKDVYQKDSNFYQAMELGMLETVGIGWKKADEYLSKLSQVTAEQVRDVARKYLVDDNLSIVYLDPQPISEAPKPAKLLGGHHAF